MLIGILSRGHVLLEGLPGLGKTALVRTVGHILKLDFKRIQFTPDLMPGDVLGTHILQETSSGKRELVFQPGPVFTNILLADEINRASPKTQSAMLETMQENCVTLLGTTRALPQPFFVLASQNPIELEGTYPLPEAQLDRFLFRAVVRQCGCRGAGPDHFRAPPWRTARADLADGARAVGIAVSNDGPDLSAASGFALHCAAGFGHASGRGGSHRGGEPLCQLRGFAARGHRHCRGGAGHALVCGRPSVGFEDVKTVVPRRS